MSSKSKYAPTVTNRAALAFARRCMACGSMAEVAAEVRRFAKKIRGSGRRRGSWKYYLSRFAAALDAGRLPHAIFKAEGNSKLPFWCFSTLPIITCPGAGACGGIEREGAAPDLAKAFCYSLTAWRYPAAFLRQLQNTLLLKHDRRAIIEAFKTIPEGSTLRLYVDGDFDSESTALFWFNLLRQRLDLSCYGYSKSWRIIEALAGAVPPNYALNLSSGGLDDAAPGFRERLRALPFVRGDFLAIQVRGRFARGFKRYSDPAYHRAVREAAAAAGLGRVFSCPGQCGSCTGAGHACGAQRQPATVETAPEGRRFVMALPIAIGIH